MGRNLRQDEDGMVDSNAETDEGSAEQPVRLVRFVGAETTSADDLLAREEPLQICINRIPYAMTLRTPGNDADLAAGYLLGEQVITASADIRRITVNRRCEGQNRVDVRLVQGIAVPKAATRVSLTSACGICGVAHIAELMRTVQPLPVTPPLAVDLLYSLPDALRAGQGSFSRTGGLHAAALFTWAGRLVGCAEDIGRHNAVDKVIGYALRRGKGPQGLILMVSGRAGFEIVQKAAVAGCPALCSVSAPSSMAVHLARTHGMLLAGFLRGKAMNVYAGFDRLAG